MTQFCHDYGDNPTCLGEADPRFIMRFDDLGKPPLHWCAHCGPQMHAINDALQKRFGEDPDFAKELNVAVTAAEKEKVSH